MERGRSVRAALLALICDTGVVYAAVVRGDRRHAECADLVTETEERLVVPAPVIVELDWLATARSVPAVIDHVLGEVDTGALAVEELRMPDYARVRELCTTYADLPLGLVDASVIAVAERLGEATIATLDHRHFSVVRPKHVRALTLVP